MSLSILALPILSTSTALFAYASSACSFFFSSLVTLTFSFLTSSFFSDDFVCSSIFSFAAFSAEFS